MPDAFALAGVLPPDDDALAAVGACCSVDHFVPPQVAFAPGDLPWADAVRDIVADVVDRSGRPDLIVWVDGWANRGRPYDYFPTVVVCHHDANRGYASDYPALGIIRDGRSDLPGPLSEFGIGRHDVDGWARVYVIAAGVSNNAGPGGWAGYSGNTRTVGIEWSSDGIGEAVEEHHRRTYRLLVSCILRRLGNDASLSCDHKEWSSAGKIDRTGFDPDEERAAVQALLDGATPDPEPEDDLFSDQDREDLNHVKAVVNSLKEDFIGAEDGGDYWAGIKRFWLNLGQVGTGGVDANALADQIVDALGPGLSAEVADLLAERLSRPGPGERLKT